MSWKRRSKSFANREFWIAGLSMTMGAGLGMGVAYFCDPDCGRARRKKVGDRATRLITQGGCLVEHKGKNLLNRAEGMLPQSRSVCPRQEDGTDEVLLERVRSRLGHAVQHPHSIATTVEQGIVRLTGTATRQERKRVLKKIRGVPGVLKVEELLVDGNRRGGRSIPRFLGGLAGAAVLLAVASGRSRSTSGRVAA